LSLGALQSNAEHFSSVQQFFFLSASLFPAGELAFAALTEYPDAATHKAALTALHLSVQHVAALVEP
jgi:hypothetical protein